MYHADGKSQCQLPFGSSKGVFRCGAHSAHAREHYKNESFYGIKIDRRTVYGAIALLTELGYDISTYEDNGVGYYLRSRELEQSEVLLLTNAVYSIPFIPAKQTE